MWRKTSLALQSSEPHTGQGLYASIEATLKGITFHIFGYGPATQLVPLIPTTTAIPLIVMTFPPGHVNGDKRVNIHNESQRLNEA